MDVVGLTILKEETRDDIRMIHQSFEEAKNRQSIEGIAGLESTAYNLVRFYNGIEQMSLRIAKAFENHIDDEKGWHSELINRLSLQIPGIRPQFWPKSLLPYLREIQGFRHVFVHSYELMLEAEKLNIVMKACETINKEIDSIWNDFFNKVTEGL